MTGTMSRDGDDCQRSQLLNGVCSSTLCFESHREKGLNCVLAAILMPKKGMPTMCVCFFAILRPGFLPNRPV